MLFGVVLLGGSIGVSWISAGFGFDVELADMPIAGFVLGYLALALASLLVLPWLIRRSGPSLDKPLLTGMLLAGLVMRLVFFGSEPVLEDDHHRYLWDGAVVVAGLNPYARSPEDVIEAKDPSKPLESLREDGRAVLEQLNHPQYRTIYPPVAQAAFALSHIVAPFSLEAWRGVLLLCELGIVGLVIAMLVQVGRSPLWGVLYWWNPVVIKETMNSAHMEPVLMLAVTAGVFLASRGALKSAAIAFTIAAGVKLWPGLLVAVVFRQWLNRPVLFGAALLLFAAALALMAWPVISGGLGETSGFVAYAKNWFASSAAIKVSGGLTSLIMPDAVVHMVGQGLADRLPLVLALAAIAGLLCLKPAADSDAVLKRLFLITVAIYLLLPSQFPWYFLWVAPFLCLFPVRGLLLAGALSPVHYLFFYLSVFDLEPVYRAYAPWLIWGPVWALLAWDFLRRGAVPRPGAGTAHA